MAGLGPSMELGCSWPPTRPGSLPGHRTLQGSAPPAPRPGGLDSTQPGSGSMSSWKPHEAQGSRVQEAGPPQTQLCRLPGARADPVHRSPPFLLPEGREELLAVLCLPRPWAGARATHTCQGGRTGKRAGKHPAQACSRKRPASAQDPRRPTSRRPLPVSPVLRGLGHTGKVHLWTPLWEWNMSDPHSTLSPAGPTAAPGLAPDLVSRGPWPRGALLAVALAVGVLITCLLCVLCCCHHRHRRHRKQPGDKEAVGLGSVSGQTVAHLVQPDADAADAGSGGAQQWGRVLLSLEYDFGSQEIKVGLRQAADLQAEGTADPCARVSISTQAGRRHESKVHRGTLCPVFEETCCFPVLPEELPRAALQVQLLDCTRFSEHASLGELRLPLGTMDLHHVLERWYQLGPPGTVQLEQSGELCFSLQYMPGSGRLTVVVLEARGLSPGLAEPYVKVQLLLNQRKWKKRATSPQKGTAAPYFNQAFTFSVPVSQIQRVDLVLAVWARGPHLRAESVGKVLLGARASGQPLQHWADTLAHARRPVAQWHRLRPPREVDSVLALKPRRHLPVPGS
ncbi:synaptotagmin-8 [Thomomys bottae]